MKQNLGRLCCFIYPSGRRCQNQAEYQIWVDGSSNPDDYTESCAQHLGEMHDDAPVHVTYKIAEDE
jgi:hypothetical protein